MSEAQPNRYLELDVPAEPQVVQDLRRRFDEFVQGCRMTDDEREGVKVALSEACSNAVCHGSPRGNWNRLRVRFQVEGDLLSLEISDQGRGFYPNEIALPDFEEWKPSGRGLFLMQALVDEVEFERTAVGTVVRLRKRLNGACPEADGVSPAVVESR